MPSKKKPGYCVYFFAHQGIGRCIEETKDFKKREKELLKTASNPANDTYHVCCAEDKKEALKKYRDLLEKAKLKKKQQREAKKENDTGKKSSNTRKKTVGRQMSTGKRRINVRKSANRRRGVTKK